MIETRPGFLEDATPASLSNGIVGFVFAATAPVALVLAALSRGGMGEADIASWLFGGFVLNSIFTLIFCVWQRQPLVFLWSMPGTVLVGQALGHLTYPEVVGAYLGTGVLVLALGLSGIVDKAMSAIPMPVVAAMVAGVFLQFAVDWIKALVSDAWISAPMTLIFFVIGAFPAVARRLPPVIATLLVGVIATIAAGAGQGPPMELMLVAPKLTMPQFSWPAMIELVVPLAITVLVVQNGQGFAVLGAAGHKPPVNASTIACGVASLISACVGTVSCCLAGAVMAILVTDERRRSHYVAGLTLGGCAMLFGLAAPMIARAALSAPRAMIATLAGLAMLKILTQAFSLAFRGAYVTSALIAFSVTVSGITIANIGAPFWGIVLGTLAAYLLERDSRPAPG